MGSYDCTSDKMRYDGIDSCAASTLLAGGISSCRYGAWAWATAPPCANTAQSTSATGMASIDPAKCRGCAKCTAACPKGLISFVPLKKQAVVRCSNCDKGAETMKVCKVAVSLRQVHEGVRSGRRKGDELLRESRSCKVHRCGKCAEVCPRHVITMLDA